jgi:UDP-N-acetylglucosamine--N-acetylmuramyl-(pentapeptide) pyrophosphoryl-undecaprenol N-acetylglucosamine transferase
MRGPVVPCIVIAAGGTGGHFFPAEALGAELLARGHRVVLMTDARSGAMKSAVFAGLEQHVLPGSGIAGRGVWRGIKAVFGLAAGVLRARSVLSTLPVGAVVGFGGYPCVAPVLAAGLSARRPAIILHEQNAVLGRANRFLARRVDRLALSFAGTAGIPAAAARKAVLTGNPVRPAILALDGVPYQPPTDRIRLLILGGSLGARVFSDIVPPALLALPADLRARLTVTQQCRAEDVDRVRRVYEAAGIAADLSPFFADVAARLAAAHLVIARAGASTICELAVAGRPSILVPLPGAIDDHQTANAQALAAAGAARVMPQPDFTAAALTATLTELCASSATLATMAAAAHIPAKPDATARLADLVESLVKQTALEAHP